MSEAWDGTTRLWNAMTGQSLLEAPRGSGSAFSSDGQRIGFMTSSWDETCSLGAWFLSAAPERRVLYDPPSGPAGWRVSVGASGRLLATAGDYGIRIWHIPSETVIALLPIGPMAAAVFEPDGGALISSGNSGLHHWPVHWDHSQMRLGPPQALYDRATRAAAVSADGRQLVAHIQGEPRAVVLDPRNPAKVTVTGPHPSMQLVPDISPDGRLALTGTWRGRGGRVWSAASGELVVELGESLSARGEFSPDGRFVLLWDAEHQAIWDCATWQQVRRFDWGAGAADAPAPPDWRYVYPNATRMSDPESLEPVCDLPTFSQLHACFLPSNPWLALGHGGNAIVSVWDLYTVRARLAEIGLDWDAPQYPTPIDSDTAPPMEVRVDLGDFAPDLTATTTTALEEERRRAATTFSLPAADPVRLNDEAWKVVIEPGRSPDAYHLALRCAEAACRGKPGHESYLNTLGIAQYRAGLHEEAVRTLELCDRLHRVKHPCPTPDDACAGYPGDVAFIAMALYELGRRDEAVEALDRLRGMCQQPDWTADADCQSFLRQAEDRIGAQSGATGASTRP